MIHWNHSPASVPQLQVTFRKNILQRMTYCKMSKNIEQVRLKNE